VRCCDVAFLGEARGELGLQRKLFSQPESVSIGIAAWRRAGSARSAQLPRDSFGGLPELLSKRTRRTRSTTGGGACSAIRAWTTASSFGQRYTPDEINGNATDVAASPAATISELR